MEIPPPDVKHKNHEQEYGPLVGIIIIVALIAAGGIYFLVMQEINRHTTAPPGQEQASL